MSVIRQEKSTSMGLKLETGTTASGGTAYTTISIPGINPGAADAEVLAFGAGVGTSLISVPVNSVIRTDKATLVND